MAKRKRLKQRLKKKKSLVSHSSDNSIMSKTISLTSNLDDQGDKKKTVWVKLSNQLKKMKKKSMKSTIDEDLGQSETPSISHSVTSDVDNEDTNSKYKSNSISINMSVDKSCNSITTNQQDVRDCDDKSSGSEQFLEFNETAYKNQMKKFIETLGTCNSANITESYSLNLLLNFLNLFEKQYNLRKEFDIDTTFQETFSMTLIHAIIHKVALIFKNEPILLELSVPKNELVILSDIHGSLLDLLKIFTDNGEPGFKSYLLLGDYVDKGVDEVYVAVFLFLLKICYPTKFYLLRGNHEFLDVNSKDLFPIRCKKIFGSHNAYRLLNYAFEFLPLAAIIEDEIFCVHGGISQWMINRNCITKLKRPLRKNKDMISRLIISDMVWADVKRNDYDTFEGLGFTTSKRGVGYAFNEVGLKKILKDLNVTRLIRGHQPSEDGFKEDYSGLCYTVHVRNFLEDSPIGGGYCILKKINVNPTTNKGDIIIEPRRYSLKFWVPTATTAANLCHKLIENYNRQRKCSIMKSFNNEIKKDCQICAHKSSYLKILTCKKRTFLIHNQIKSFIMNDRRKDNSNPSYPLFHRMLSKDNFLPVDRFPMLLDFIYAHPVRSKQLISQKELDLMKALKDEWKSSKLKLNSIDTLSYKVLPLQMFYQVIDKDSNYKELESLNISDSEVHNEEKK